MIHVEYVSFAVLTNAALTRYPGDAFFLCDKGAVCGA
jgi:hypothetical protein